MCCGAFPDAQHGNTFNCPKVAIPNPERPSNPCGEDGTEEKKQLQTLTKPTHAKSHQLRAIVDSV